MNFAVGSEIAGPVRVMTPERIEWYDSAMLTAAKGELAQVGINIHTDEQYAKSQGFTAVIADGMITTNWMSSMMVEHFGMDYLERGELRTKFIKPIYLDQTVFAKGKITAVERLSSGAVVYTLDVWCEDEHATKLTVGDAKVEAAPRA